MTSTPDALWMSPTNSKSQRHQVTHTPTKSSRGVSDYHLKLKSIIGTTAAATNGFTYSNSASAFAVCAGSAAAVAQVDSHAKITWKYFRGGPSTSSLYGSDSFQELPKTPITTTTATSTSENRLVSSLRGKGSIKHNRSPLLESSTVPHDHTLTRQKTRAVACVSMTMNGELLAIGESGQNPRIMLYSIKGGSPEIPLAILKEHTFGIRCLAFSEDMRWLCSIGDIHDGFVHLWAVNPKTGAAKLHSTNKCTSFVQDVAFMGTSFITFGTRHVKLWKTDPMPPASPSKSTFILDQPRTLSGRNCLLGKFIESTFSCLAVINDTTAVLCTDKGQICLLEDTGRAPELYFLLQVEFSIYCAEIDKSLQQLVVGGPQGITRIIPFSLCAEGWTVSVVKNVGAIISSETSNVMALGLLPKKLVVIGSNHRISIYDADRTDDGQDLCGPVNTIYSHSNPISGVGYFSQANNRVSGFFSWSTDGSVIVYSPEGISTRQLKVPLEQQDETYTNELRVLRISQDNQHYISGDKSGSLRLLETTGCNECAYVKAHQGEINDIAMVRRKEDINLLATCGRDRIMQIFQKYPSRFELLQTIGHHSSAVNEVRFCAGGSSLLSSSSDRTVVVYALALSDGSIAYLATRIITLKASPLSMVLTSEHSKTLLISTGDRKLNKYDIDSGHHMSSTKLVNADTNETVLLSNLTTHESDSFGSSKPLLFGISSADRCIRVHDMNTGVAVATEYGHSQGISSLAVNPYQTEGGKIEYRLVSTGLDGSIMMWTLTTGNSASEGHPGTPKFGHTQPLRRILSHSTLLEHRKALEAGGIHTLPSTPTRYQSPMRVRKRPSNYVLKPHSSRLTESGFANKVETPTRKSFGNHSPAATPPAYSSSKPLSEPHHTKNTSIAKELNASADQLCQSLRAYRKKLSSSPFDTLTPEKMEELNRELNLTIHAMFQTTKCTTSTAGERGVVGDLLDVYSEKLAQIVEKRIVAAAAAAAVSSSVSVPMTKSSNAADTRSENLDVGGKRNPPASGVMGGGAVVEDMRKEPNERPDAPDEEISSIEALGKLMEERM